MKKPSSRGQKGKKALKRPVTALTYSPRPQVESPKNISEERKPQAQGTPPEQNPLSRFLQWWGVRGVEEQFAQLVKEKRIKQFSSELLQSMKEMRDTLRANGHQKEVNEFGFLLRRFRALSSEQKSEIHEDSLFYEVLMTMASLSALAAYLKQGDQAVLDRLPRLLDLDGAFFLRQPWIIDLIVAWRKRGEQEKIMQVFFGLGQRRRRSFKTIMEQEQRDAKIDAEVERLRKEGRRYNETMHIVSDNWKELGLNTKMSPGAVRRAYEKRKAGYTPLKALFE